MKPKKQPKRPISYFEALARGLRRSGQKLPPSPRPVAVPSYRNADGDTAYV